MKNIKDKTIQARVSEEEKSEILKRVHIGVSLSEFIVSTLLERPIVKGEIPRADPELIRLISKMSNNLNQSTKALHKRQIPEYEYLTHISILIEQLHNLIESQEVEGEKLWY